MQGPEGGAAAAAGASGAAAAVATTAAAAAEVEPQCVLLRWAAKAVSGTDADDQLAVTYTKLLTLLTKAPKLLQARKPNAPSEWMKKLPQMARR